jgi:hypothetical protein
MSWRGRCLMSGIAGDKPKTLVNLGSDESLQAKTWNV